ncbi:MAG TPA: hypothetical protein VGB52_03305 [Actinomycetota bacterium]
MAVRGERERVRGKQMGGSGELKNPLHEGWGSDDREGSPASARSFRRAEEGAQAADVYERDITEIEHDRGIAVALGCLQPPLEDRRGREVDLAAEAQMCGVSALLTGDAEWFLTPSCTCHASSPPFPASEVSLLRRDR